MNNIDKSLNKEHGQINRDSYRKGWKARERLLPSIGEIDNELYKAGLHDKVFRIFLTKTISKRMEGKGI